MSGFEVQIGLLRKAAAAAGSAADQASTVKPGAGVDDIATALPGSTAGAGAALLATTFNERAGKWADEIDRWSASVTASANDYAKSDQAAREAFG
ncbi:hypothetical protein [Actinoplanes couchii]|uniref:Excreted virulence factor EspC, type VII ESX diderm n=1 Tax=Actinoplanes couchii TaxID=403638 RepID=A0ABQ3XU66_9ACTN|nr:hypothetical protein [Actinoplanes couchii]MDR6319983.1 hypothetical protein [Actinoplanes couchii]GID62063.1 hypothetical protein Aco03nite_104670 [Actinoplanes couchii]